ALYARLRLLNPSPFMGLLEGEGWALVSGSPERLFKKEGARVLTRPIAGTRPRGRTEEEDLLLEEELLAKAPGLRGFGRFGGVPPGAPLDLFLRPA
ncbi:chorismate-binding protein, partial [Thermus scotoductus]|uniref:chorismate-binding protein n=1 Tax=Thermus scotoductus TaxID=37636 RepID=UPI003F51819E